MPLLNFKGKTVLITGASSGIGETLAKELAARGANLALLARRVDRLKSLAAECERRGVRALALECDVTRDGDLESAAAQARTAFGGIDVVIANAGFGVAGNFESLKLEDYQRQFETNVYGVLRTVYATLADLKKSRGNIAILGSVAGHVALPGNTPYSMSKFAVRAFADGLVHELRPHGVTVTLISPGFVASEIRQVDNRGELQAHTKDPIPRWIVVPTVRAANEIIRAVERGKREQVVTGHGKVIVFLNRHCHWLFEAIKRRGLKARVEPK